MANFGALGTLRHAYRTLIKPSTSALAQSVSLSNRFSGTREMRANPCTLCWRYILVCFCSGCRLLSFILSPVSVSKPIASGGRFDWNDCRWSSSARLHCRAFHGDSPQAPHLRYLALDLFTAQPNRGGLHIDPKLTPCPGAQDGAQRL